MFSNESNVVQQSMPKFKEQPDTRLQTVSIQKHQVKSIKKQLRFETDYHTCVNILGQRSPIQPSNDICKKLESTYFEPQWKSQRHQPQLHQNRNKLETIDTIDMKKAQTLIKENCFSLPLTTQNNHQQLRANNSIKLVQHEATNVGFGSGRFGMIDERNQLQKCDEILLNILEEQQQHMRIQENQMLMLEKQNIEQQKQICMLQYRIQQLLLQKEADQIESRQRGEKYATAKEMASVDVLNISKTENGSVEPMNFGCEMSAFIEDVNDENSSIDIGIERLYPNIGLSKDYPRGDVLFGRTIHSTHSTSAVFNYKIDGLVSSANSSSDITTQA